MAELQAQKSTVDATTAEHGTNSSIHDSEKGTVDYLQLENASVQSYSWEQVTVEVKDRKTKQPLNLLSKVSGYVAGGEYQR
jgi:hypothetical protein